MTFAVVIIIAVYLPILFLQGLEGRMFRPMAITVCAALAGSLLLALTMVPMLASFAFRKGIPLGRVRKQEHGWMCGSERTATARLLMWAMDHRVRDGWRGRDGLGRRARLAVLHRHRIHAASSTRARFWSKRASCREFR